MKNCPGPSICEKCGIVGKTQNFHFLTLIDLKAMVWKEIDSCKHIFCHNCLSKDKNQRQKQLQINEDKKWEKKQVFTYLLISFTIIIKIN